MELRRQVACVQVRRRLDERSASKQQEQLLPRPDASDLDTIQRDVVQRPVIAVRVFAHHPWVQVVATKLLDGNFRHGPAVRETL